MAGAADRDGAFAPVVRAPAEIRALRDYTRTRLARVRDRTREYQRLEKLLEGALVKLSAHVSKLTTKSARAMIEALAAGMRDPHQLADLARGSLRGKQDTLARALEGMMFGEHHRELTAMHLDFIAFLDRRIAALDDAIEACLEAIPASWGVDAGGVTGPGAGAGEDAAVLAAAERLAEIPGVSPELARAIIAETGLDMTRFPAAAHLVSWAGLAPVAQQSGPRSRKPKKGQGDSYLRGFCTQAANGAARTDTFLGERCRRIGKHRGGAIARVAVARSILIIIWHLLKDPRARFADLGPDHYARKANRDKKIRGHIRQLEALGLEVTVTPRTA